MCVSITLVGCEVMKLKDLDNTKPVEIEKEFIGTTLKQDGKILYNIDAVRKFAEIPEAQHAVTRQRIYFWSGAASGFIGGALVGWGIADNKNDDRGALIVSGVGLIGVSFLFHYLSDSYLSDAAEIYNGQFKGSKNSKNFELHPVFLSFNGGTGAGLKLLF